jgi:hypothetical protein
MSNPMTIRDMIRYLSGLPASMYMPAAAGVLVVLVAGSLLWGWWFFIVGLVIAGAGLYFWVANIASSVAQSRGTLPAAPAPRIDLNTLDGKYRAYMERALDTRAGIERAVSGTQDPGVQRALTDSTRDLPELIDTIYSLAFKAQSVQSASGTSSNMAQLSEDIKRLDDLIKSTTDEFQKSQYYATMDGKLQQMQNLTDTQVAVQRWDAQLDNAVSSLDTILTQILRIKSSEVLSYTGATDDVSRTLHRQVEELKATSDALDSVYGASQY